MILQDKKNIQTQLKHYCEKTGSQNAASKKLKGVSSATITQILTGKWENISDDMWRNIASQIEGNKGDNWKLAETSVYNKIHSHFSDAKNNPQGIRALIANASMGKSVAIKSFCNQHKKSYYILCHKHLNIRGLLREMLKQMGKDSSGTAGEMLDNLLSYLMRDETPLFIIDEVDKLKDDVLTMFIDIENKLHGKCGLAFLATPYLKKRIELGVAKNKCGFTELFSRMRKIFWDITPDKVEFRKDVAAICNANGIEDKDTIIRFINSCENDFRVLGDLVAAHHASQAKQ